MTAVGIILVFVWLVILTCIEALAPVSGGIPVPIMKKRRLPDALIKAETRLVAMASLHRLIVLIVVVVMVATLVLSLHWWVSILAAVIIVGVSGPVSRMNLVQSLATRVVAPLVPRFAALGMRQKKVLSGLRSKSTARPAAALTIASVDELLELIDHAHGSLSPKERTAVHRALMFPSLTVADIMTARRAVKYVSATELLGPLVLSELHALGHRQLPVIEKSIDTIVGTLTLDSLLSLDVRRSVTAGKAMNPHIVTVQPDTSLHDTLSLLTDSREYMAIIRDEGGRTLGLVTLTDILKRLVS